MHSTYWGVQIAELFASGMESGRGKAAAGTAKTAAGGVGRRGKGKGSMASNTLATKFRDNLTTLM